ncbi:hypothetical protein WYO_4705 [Methylobacterium sp. GXF4]|uniref:hypothetical protein n=1 Tax=Methylobacterium sp. GXF4 TaxID=1096546 RepID=UPI000269A067|nr:hypothetical protein [Methylobacterium sp. GXF4]EIZ82829.1 hypothetical protein WYO_4705 [Methylobacterium sp. GXF4]
MALAQLLPLTEAATFTAGCMVLRSARIDPERVANVLLPAATILAAILLIGLTPTEFADAVFSLDPGALWPPLP